MESNRNDQYEQILNKLSAEVDSLNSKQSEEAKMSKTVGNSPAIRRVLDQIYMVAPTSMTVILQGESGTGKELFSSLIHQRSTRSKNEYLALDCGAIPDSLIESELFGYEKGAFTGAISRKQGVFERANGGTLLLDEISDYFLEYQGFWRTRFYTGWITITEVTFNGNLLTFGKKDRIVWTGIYAPFTTIAEISVNTNDSIFTFRNGFSGFSGTNHNTSRAFTLDAH